MNVFIDTFVLSRICWSKKNEKFDLLKQKKWNDFISQVNRHSFCDLERDFRWITSDLLMLEIIGLGSIKDKKFAKKAKKEIGNKRKRNVVFDFEQFQNYIQQDEWKQFYRKPEKFIEHMVKRIEDYIDDQMTPRNLYKQGMNFLTNYNFHDHAYLFRAAIKRWVKTIRKKESYAQFKQNFLLDTIQRYTVINLATLPTNEREEAINFWASVLGTIANEYYAVYKNDSLFEGSLLGLFAQIHKVGKFFNDLNDDSRKRTSYDSLLKDFADMVDAESIHYALVGKKEIHTNEPVIVITGDKKNDVERRLECMYKNLIEISQIPKKYGLDKNLTIDLCPGTVLCVNDAMEIVDVIKVKDHIQKLNKK